MAKEERITENWNWRIDQKIWKDMNTSLDWSYYQTILSQRKECDIDNDEPILRHDLSKNDKQKEEGWTDMAELSENNMKTSWISSQNING